MDKEEIEKTRKAGEIVKKIKSELDKWVKKDMLLIEIAEKIESDIIKHGGKIAFPVNLGINDYTAHYTPHYNDETKASGLLKIDFGVHIDGFAADNSVSIDLENTPENKKLIKTSIDALNNAINAVKEKKSLGQIGLQIQKESEKNNFTPIKNLSGHGIQRYQLHTSPNIPNFDNNSNIILEDGIYAIEPFITTGVGMVYDGKESGIYELKKIDGFAVRDKGAREILQYILDEYQTLPFCSRWLVKKFGTRALISLRFLEQAQILHQFSQLIEKSHSKVAQSEHTIIIHKGSVEVVT